MKIAIAQTKSIKGAILSNIERHKKFIALAVAAKAEAIFFPELSLTGYEPELANELAINESDNRLDTFQKISNENRIIIGIGLPTRGQSKVRISMIIFEPNKSRRTYSKQQLHKDEQPYFENGIDQIIISVYKTKIALAICYESLQTSHVKNAHTLGANIYLASVAKPANGIEQALKHFPTVAKQYSMPILMVNCVGFCDNFLSAGNSAIWSKDGSLVAQLDHKAEGILIFDTETEEILKSTMQPFCHQN